MSVFKDLDGHPVLKWDVVHVGIVLSPYMVDFMKQGKLRKKKRDSLLLLNHRPVDCDRHELSRPAEIGGVRSV